MTIPPYQLETHAALLLDLAEAMRDRAPGACSPLTCPDVKEHLRDVERMGDPLHLAAQLRAMIKGGHDRPQGPKERPCTQ